MRQLFVRKTVSRARSFGWRGEAPKAWLSRGQTAHAVAMHPLEHQSVSVAGISFPPVERAAGVRLSGDLSYSSGGPRLDAYNLCEASLKLAACPSISCTELRTLSSNGTAGAGLVSARTLMPAIATGMYAVRPDETCTRTRHVFCEMDIDGGGWSLVANAASSGPWIPSVRCDKPASSLWPHYQACRMYSWPVTAATAATHCWTGTTPARTTGPSPISSLRDLWTSSS